MICQFGFLSAFYSTVITVTLFENRDTADVIRMKSYRGELAPKPMMGILTKFIREFGHRERHRG